MSTAVLNQKDLFSGPGSSTSSDASYVERGMRFFQEKLEYTISPVTLRKTIASGQELQIIDLRSKEYFSKGAIPQAMNIELDALEAASENLNKDVLVVLCCYDHVCNLGAKAAQVLLQKDFKVKELEGGYEDWLKHMSFDKHNPPN